MKKLTGFYRGIVIQNNSPTKDGRIKVFIPHLSSTIYDNWIAENKDKTFSKLGENNNSTISVITDELKAVLPWAEPASSIVGETGDTYFNAYENISQTGDSNENRFEKETLGDKPAKTLEDNPPTDNFDEDYTPRSYSNAAKGSFSIPKVNSHVWCFFDNGNPMFPVYFAACYGKSNWNTIFDDLSTYPDNFENLSIHENDEGYDNSYRNKWVLSQKGGVIEIINTDSEESICITHYNGSYKIWEPNKTKELVQNDEYKLVQNDSYITIKNNSNQQIDGNLTIVVNGTANIEASQFNITGPINHSGGNITTDGDVIADGVSLKTHTHGGVESGGSNTLPPN